MAASMAVAASSASVVSLQAQSARLSSSSSFGAPLVSVAPLRPAAAKQHLAVARAALPEEISSRIARRDVLAGLVAVGAALTNVAHAKAAQGPGGDGAERTNQKADDLLKEADKFKNEQSPPRFGSGEAGPAEKAGDLTQQAGSGAVETLQGTKTSEPPETLVELKKNFDKLFDSGDAEIPDVAGKVDSDIATAKGKVKDDVANAKKFTDTVGSGIDAKAKVDELVSDAQSKSDEASKSGSSFIDSLTKILPQ